MILGLDVGGHNIKASIVDSDLTDRGHVQFSTLLGQRQRLEVLSDLKKWLTENRFTKFDAIALTRSPFRGSQSYLDTTIAVDKEVKVALKRFLPSNAKVKHLSRDGGFYSIREVVKDVKHDYQNIIKYVDANWLPPALLVGEQTHSKDYVFVSFGTTSTSMIPVVDKEPVVRPHENRLGTSKLVLIGLYYTPVFGFLHEVVFRNSKMPTCPFFVPLTADVALFTGVINRLPFKNYSAKSSRALARHNIAGLVGEDIGLLHESDYKSLCRQALDKLREIMESNLAAVCALLKRAHPDVFVSGINNEFFIELMKGTRGLIDTRLGNTSTAYAVAVQYARNT